jgi:hypothetical protein
VKPPTRRPAIDEYRNEVARLCRDEWWTPSEFRQRGGTQRSDLAGVLVAKGLMERRRIDQFDPRRGRGGGNYEYRLKYAGDI